MLARARPSATWQQPRFAAKSGIVQPLRKKMGSDDTVAERTQCQGGQMDVNVIANRQSAFCSISDTYVDVCCNSVGRLSPVENYWRRSRGHVATRHAKLSEEPGSSVKRVMPRKTCR